jgi:transcriptional regulator with XRE-family HTH domain
MDQPADSATAAQDQLALGGALRELRRQAGLTQEQVGDRLGTDATFVSRIERGKRGVRWHTLQRFLRVLGADLHQLADVGEPRPAARGLETPDGHAIHYNESGAVIGLTLLNVRHTLEQEGQLTLSLPPEHLAAEALQPILAAA